MNSKAYVSALDRLAAVLDRPPAEIERALRNLESKGLIATLSPPLPSLEVERLREAHDKRVMEAVSQWGGYASIADFLAVLAEVRSSCERAGLMECAEEIRRARSVINALSALPLDGGL